MAERLVIYQCIVIFSWLSCGSGAHGRMGGTEIGCQE